MNLVNTTVSANSALRVISGELMINEQWTAHNEAVIAYVASGTMNLETTTSSYNLHKGDLFILSPNQKYLIDNYGNANVQVIMLNLNNSASLTQEYIPQNVIRALVTGNCTHFAKISPAEAYYKNVFEAFTTIYMAEEERSEYFQLLVHGKLYELFFFILSSGTIKIYDIENQGKKYRALRRITEYVNENYCDLITLDTISQKTGLSRYYISHLFKELMNTTFINYLNELRLTRAAMLLTTTDTPVIEIAGMSGFNNISNFNRAFKMFYSLTPSKYRKSEERAM